MSAIDKWNLESLFKNQNDLDGFVKRLQTKAVSFEKKYSGKLSNIVDFEVVIGEYENLLEGIGRIMTYAFLIFAKDSSNGAYYSKYELIANKIQDSLIFFEIELTNLDSKIINKAIKSSKKYKYFLQKLVEQKKHLLSKEEEKILLKVSPVGKEAFSRLFDEYMSSLKFKFDGKIVSEEEILSKLHFDNRVTRKAAQKELTKRLRKSNRAHFPSVVLCPGETYRQVTVYKFGVEK